MDLAAAWHELGLSPVDDLLALRAAYTRRLRQVHPDLSSDADANAATVRLQEAYALVRAAVEQSAQGTRPEPERRPVATGRFDAAGFRPTGGPGGTAVVLDDSTLAVPLPPDETYFVCLDAADVLGEVTFVDPPCGMVQVMVEFVDAPPCQLLFTLQGRATGVTEVMCNVDSLEDAPAPPSRLVLELLADTVNSLLRSQR